MLSYLKELNVLYVDDDTVACENMKNTLSYFFKKVFINHNGLDAINTYREENIHLLLVDYDMPRMNGVEFLKEIRSLNNNIPAVILSSYSDKEKLMQAIKLNLVAYLVKPLEFSELKNILKECLEWMGKFHLLKIDLTNNISYDLSTKIISVDKLATNTLTNYEFRIFEYLLSHKNSVVTFSAIFYVLDDEEENKKSLTSIIYKINKKFPSPIIKNIKDVGYTIVMEG